MPLLKSSRFFGIPAVAAVLVLAPAALRAAPDPFEDIIRKTDPLAPADERKAFHLPPGFDIELVASEPEIGKPINMAFDEKGRLWVTQSREYPFPVPVGTKGRDRIGILEDFAEDGRARKISTFVTGLNIPIGLYPYKGGAISHSIPSVHYFEDTNGDGVADKDTVLYSRFGFEKDTHGMTGAFRRGFDGWLYADHGFNNDSVVKGADGHTIKMNSGNCYRMRVDGSRVEQYSWGQVNPFGLMFDPLGNLWSADCHSAPIYQLLRGGYYPSFGKPDDGLGMAPLMMTHQHGSTAIAGIIYYAATNFPPAFQSNIFIGNVMTSRINRDSLMDHGTTRLAHEEPDFMSSDDPWFRPVDLQFGPDGAIYIADFYNRIIGHYEVRLDHPGRDRERGRIWRIVYKGGKDARHFDCSGASIDELWADLDNPNITPRMLAMNQFTDRIGATAIEPLRQKLAGDASTFQRIHGLWALYRLGGLTDALTEAAAANPNQGVRTHVMRILADLPQWGALHRRLVRAGLEDSDPWVKRAAADAMGLHPGFDQIRPLIAARRAAPEDDTHLVHVIRMALRDQLVPASSMQRLGELSLGEPELAVVADVVPGVHSPESAAFLLGYLQTAALPRDAVARAVKYVARYLAPDRMDEMAEFARKQFSRDLDFQLALLKSLQEGAAQRGGSFTTGMRKWGEELASELLAAPGLAGWWNAPLDEYPNSKNPWHVQNRKSADGDPASPFLSSLPGGEQLTGMLRCDNFSIPAKLTFWVAGHNGSPDKNDPPKNFVRLRLADGTLVKEAVPPRNDLAQRVQWDLGAFAGKEGYFEIIDADTAGAYAWLAVGRWEPAVITAPQISPAQESARETAAADLAAALGLTKLAPALVRLLNDPRADYEARIAGVKALVHLDPEKQATEIGRVVALATAPAALREQAALALGDVAAPEARVALIAALPTAPNRLQAKIGLALASGKAGAEDLLKEVEAGRASARLLQEKPIIERLRVSKPDNGEARVVALTAKLPPASAERQKLIDSRLHAFDRAKADPEQGAKVFAQNCVVCHSLDGKGALIGPQLDGVGGRGTERLMEDVLDPSRNVDKAFRYSTITLNNDEVISGLQRREEGEVIVFADATGKEISVAKKDIKERVESEYSLMPDNFGEVIKPEDFDNLVGYLLTKGSKKP
jgi:putative heme-binding domain-containing protein